MCPRLKTCATSDDASVTGTLLGSEIGSFTSSGPDQICRCLPFPEHNPNQTGPPVTLMGNFKPKDLVAAFGLREAEPAPAASSVAKPTSATSRVQSSSGITSASREIRALPWFFLLIGLAAIPRWQLNRLLYEKRTTYIPFLVCQRRPHFAAKKIEGGAKASKTAMTTLREVQHLQNELLSHR